MTSVRMSFVFAPEDEFKKGIGSKDWIAPPSGSYFSSTGTRQTSAIYTTGSKKWETTAYGAYSGTWDWTFMLDYHYLEPLMLAFDTVNGKKWIENPSYDKFTSDDHTFVFKKDKTGRVPSFTVRRKILHTVAGGDKDELVELYGCVVNTISFSRSASTSQYQVQMSGTYANEEMTLGDLGETDYQSYNGELVEYSCVAVADSADSKIDGATYIANTDSVSVSIQNNTNMVFNTCTPFATQYYEDRNQFQISTSCYSTDPQAYKTRMYSGGFTNEKLKPMSKGLKPMEKMYIISFNGEVDEDKVSDAYNNSECSVCFEATKLVVKSMKWVNGDGSKLTDSLSSVDCRDITLTIKCDEGGDSTSLFKNTMESYTPKKEDTKGYVFKSSIVTDASFMLYRSTTVPVIGTVTLVQEKDVTDGEDSPNEKMVALSSGYVFMKGTTEDVTKATSLDGLVVEPNITDTVPGLTIEQRKDPIYIDISGEPTQIGNYYLFVFNPTTKRKGAIKLSVVSP
jgi:hypothetical protein